MRTNLIAGSLHHRHVNQISTLVCLQLTQRCVAVTSQQSQRNRSSSPWASYPFLSSERSFSFWRPHLNDSPLISPPASLIQEMNSDDPLVQQKAVLETEERLRFTEEVREEDGCRTTLNKTVISPPQASTKVSFSITELHKQIQRGGLPWSRGSGSFISNTPGKLKHSFVF